MKGEAENDHLLGLLLLAPSLHGGCRVAPKATATVANGDQRTYAVSVYLGCMQIYVASLGRPNLRPFSPIFPQDSIS